MRRVLAVAEKPSIARQLVLALAKSNHHQETSFSVYNPIFRFSIDFLSTPSEVLLTSVTGHIREIRFGSEWENWQTVNPLHLLDRAAVITLDSNDKLSIVRNLETLSARCSDVFLWLDCDREGEAIAYEVLEICARGNSSLTVHRAHFSSVVREELVHAFTHPGKPNPLLNKAVRCRQEADLRSGSAFTRFQTLQLRARRLVPPKQVVSYGPCQFPTLALVAERFIKHKAFHNSPFWTIRATVTKGGENVELTWERERLFDEYIASVLFEYAHEQPAAKVLSVGRRDAVRLKPLPLTTVEMQKLASSKLKISSDVVMRTAEGLYTRGFISYPRTETNSFSPGFNFRNCIEALRQVGAYTDFVAQLLDHNGFERPRSGNRDDKAHPPIHPVRPFTGETGSIEAKLYDMIARHFLANCAKSIQTEVVDVTVDVGGERFRGRGTRIVARNFLEIYERFYYIAERVFPAFEAGEILALSAFQLERGKTTPPRLLTEADLIAQMDKLGIGTDATIAEHIKHILEREFAEKPGGLFRPTRLGFALFGAYRGLGIDLINPTKRAQTEVLYARVAGGESEAGEVLREVLNEMIANFAQLQEKPEEFVRCFLEAYNAFPGSEGMAEPQAVDGLPPTKLKCVGCDGELQLLRAKVNSIYVKCSSCTKVYFFPQRGTVLQFADRPCDCGQPSRRLFREETHICDFCDNTSCPKNMLSLLQVPAASPKAKSPAKRLAARKPRGTQRPS